MNHEMRLHPEPFEAIMGDRKHVEYRVNDEKRQKIKVGDTITFFKRPDEIESQKVIVTDLKHYKNLLDMYSDTFAGELDNSYESPQAVVDDTPYYSNAEIEKYGCVAIFFKKIS